MPEPRSAFNDFAEAFRALGHQIRKEIEPHLLRFVDFLARIGKPKEPRV